MASDRRQFLKEALSLGGGLLLASGLKLTSLDVVDVANPLAAYPARDWERIYRDQYAYDRYFDWVCAPNDTHNCRVRGYVRNNVLIRMGADYAHHETKDLYGNHASINWGPRQCAKGYTFQRVVYGPYRLKYPLMRAGWKAWAEAGFPALDDELRTKFKFDSRGTDRLVKVSWEEAFRYIAKGYVAIAKTYSGEAGTKRLLAQGYAPEMVDETKGAGARCLKFRGGMGLLGVIGKYGAYRLANSMALLDAHVRGVGADKALGGRRWSNYTWHGDQAPGHPWIHGLQNAECDFNDLRSSKLIIMDGKNLVENKMVDSHWFIEVAERGGKIVVIAPEYGAPSTKADAWLPIREATDAALFLGIARWLFDKDHIDYDFVKRYTDFPLLVRADNLKRLRASEVFPDYQLRLKKDGVSFAVQGMTEEQYARIGDFVAWDKRSGGPVAVCRDDVGEHFAARVPDPALTGRFQIRTIGGEVIEVVPLFDLYRVHLKDYDLDTVSEITKTPKHLIEQLAEDIATIKPVS
ncbi:MAG TPA: molybdopterin-dependent oxidoreductase, partial [Planctomycetota bacterium]|nr:molybdopterin-dependent oxidoreductase [Planctomycetota bacterium]